MKPPKFILLAAMVLAGAGWLWHGESERQNLQTRISRLRAQLDRPAPDQAPKPRPPRRSAIERDPVDWLAVAQELRGGKSIGGLLATNARLLDHIDRMSVAELLAALDQIAAADLGKGDREPLEKCLAAALLKKDPEQGFARFAVRGRPNWEWFLGEQFSKWVARDKLAAVDWLRDHTGSGGYVGSEMIQVPFFGFLRSDPGISTAILASQAPEARLESLRSLDIRELKDRGQEEWAKIVRSQLPAKDVPKAVAWPVMRWSDGDGSPMMLDEVDAYMKRVGVTDEERKACVMAVAQDEAGWWHRTGENAENLSGLERMRQWVARQDPELLEPATLVALGEIARGQGFDQAGGLALQFHEETGNDAYLTGVLDQVDDLSDVEVIRKMVGRLTDPDLQAKYREELQHELK